MLASSAAFKLHFAWWSRVKFSQDESPMQELEDLLKQSPRLLYNASMDLLTAVLGTNLARHVLPVVDWLITSGHNKFFNQHFRNLTESRILRMSGGSCLPKNTFESVLKNQLSRLSSFFSRAAWKESAKCYREAGWLERLSISLGVVKHLWSLRARREWSSVLRYWERNLQLRVDGEYKCPLDPEESWWIFACWLAYFLTNFNIWMSNLAFLQL